jgi:dihydroorotate dehydrogenase
VDTYRLVRPALFCADPETAHELALAALRLGLHPRDGAPERASLRVSAWGLDFPNPVGIAAGFDKNAEAPGALLAMGFGFVEVGTVTPRPQPGNPRPRVFRLAGDGALINRLGFNSDGHDRVRARLEARARPGIVGVNIGANKESEDPAGDYVLGARAFAGLADYLTVNISSPNTPGLRGLQDEGALGRLLDRVTGELGDGVRPPLLVKIAPDLDDAALARIIETAVEKGVDGLIVSNTTVAREGVSDRALAAQAGGLSGRPLFAMSTRMLARAHVMSAGRLALVGVGGVSSGADAFAKIKAGASLVQLYTAMVFEGPSIAMRIKRELARLVEREGFSSVSDAVGCDAVNMQHASGG